MHRTTLLAATLSLLIGLSGCCCPSMGGGPCPGACLRDWCEYKKGKIHLELFQSYQYLTYWSQLSRTRNAMSSVAIEANLFPCKFYAGQACPGPCQTCHPCANGTGYPAAPSPYFAGQPAPGVAPQYAAAPSVVSPGQPAMAAAPLPQPMYAQQVPAAPQAYPAGYVPPQPAYPVVAQPAPVYYPPAPAAPVPPAPQQWQATHFASPPQLAQPVAPAPPRVYEPPATPAVQPAGHQQ